MKKQFLICTGTRLLACILGTGLMLSSFCFGSIPVNAAASDYQSLSEIVGVTHVDGQYHFTSGDFLNEGADKLLALGTKTIKLWLTPSYATDYPFTTWPSVTSMVALAQTTPFATVFSKSFKTYILEAYEFAAYDWTQGLTDAQASSVRYQFYLLAKYLMSTYQGTGKVFVLQNWESDNAIRLDLKNSGEQQVAISGMIKWLNARQAGITQARNELGSGLNVSVYGAAEVNRCSITINGAPKVIDTVVPYLNMDLYSYSNWETGTDAAQLYTNLSYIASKAPNSEAFGDKDVYLGEFGAAENLVSSDAAQLNQTKIQLQTALAWGVRYAVYWQLYCNEPATTYSGTPTNADCKGYWLQRPDGTYTSTWDYLYTLCRQKILEEDLNSWGKADSHSSNLKFETSAPSYFEYDPSVALRTQNTSETIVYSAGDSRYSIRSFSATLYYYTQMSDAFRVYVSPDNVSWTQVGVSLSCTLSTGSGWYRTQAGPSALLPEGTRYIKFNLRNDSNIWTPGIGRLTLNISNEISDLLNDVSNIYAYTSGWTVDSTSPGLFEGDTARFCRTADTNESIVYKLTGMDTFLAKVYYFGSVTGKVTFYTSPDAATWTQASASVDTPVSTGSGWYRVNFTPSAALPSGTKYLKISVASDANIWTPQLSQVYAINAQA